MRLLRVVVIILCSSAVIISCKSEGPATSEEAFNLLKSAYSKSDAGELEKLLSARSLEKAQAIIGMFSLMNDTQLKALSKKFNTMPESLKNLSVRDYLNIQLSIGRTAENDLSKEILKSGIIGVDVEDRKAVARLENGMKLVFVKEGSYWKFDMEELSSGDTQ